MREGYEVRLWKAIRKVDCMEIFLAYLHERRVCRHAKDTMLWTPTKSGKFIVNSLYNT